MHRRIVIAPDSFKGTATARDIAAAISRGWAGVRPDDLLVEAPMADGGEGTIDAIERCVVGSRRVAVSVLGPLGDPADAEVLELAQGAWVVELAKTSGIALLDGVDRSTCHRASTFGLGQAIRFAVDAGATRLLVGLGSSASTDGGAGMLTALGARFLDARGEPIPLGNEGLHHLDQVDLTDLRGVPDGGLVALTDVVSPLLGPEGAAAVFGPQKGATPADVPILEAGLARLASLLREVADAASPGSGSAGGTGFGVLALGGDIASGAAAIADAVGLQRMVSGADLVITGEGSFDAQSAVGKVPSIVARFADDAGVPLAVVAGRIPLDDEARRRLARPGTRLFALSELAGSSEAAMSDPLTWAEAAGKALAGSF